jgi:hypothetical protein
MSREHYCWVNEFHKKGCQEKNSDSDRRARVFDKAGPIFSKLGTIFDLRQETLAEMIGTTGSRVSFLMNRFRKLGSIDYVGGSGFQVHSSLLNVVLHD